MDPRYNLWTIRLTLSLEFILSLHNYATQIQTKFVGSGSEKDGIFGNFKF